MKEVTKPPGLLWAGSKRLEGKRALEESPLIALSGKEAGQQQVMKESWPTAVGLESTELLHGCPELTEVF